MKTVEKRTLRRFVFLSLVLLSLSACGNPVVEFSGAKNTVPKEFFDSTSVKIASARTINEIITNEDGTKIFFVGMFGFEISERDLALQISSVHTCSIAQHIGLQSGDILRKVNTIKGSSFLGENFSTLPDAIRLREPTIFLFERDAVEHPIFLLPPIDYDFDSDFVKERLYLYATDAPYRFEMVLYDIANTEVVERFDVLKELSFVSEIEKKTVRYFGDEQLFDYNEDGAKELELIFTNSKSAVETHVLLTRLVNRFEVVEYADNTGKKHPVYFETQQQELPKSFFEFARLNEDAVPEMVFWSYDFPSTEKYELVVVGEVYRWNDTLYVYDGVLSGQFERQKKLELLSTGD